MRKTKKRLDYPDEEKPTFWVPTTYNSDKRFLLGRLGSNPLFAICMNPSVASDEDCDQTVKVIIQASSKLGYDGWCVANVYPERGSYSSEVKQLEFDRALAEENCNIVANFLIEKNIKEVWGAWGDSQKPGDPIDLGKQMLLKRLGEIGVQVFYFGRLSKAGNPHHPLYLKIDSSMRNYLNLDN